MKSLFRVLFLFSLFVFYVTPSCTDSNCLDCPSGNDLCSACICDYVLSSNTNSATDTCVSTCGSGKSTVGSSSDGTGYCKCNSNQWLKVNDETCVDYCTTGSYVAQEKVAGERYCIPCGDKISNCVFCNSYGTVCITCNSGYVLKDGACTKCGTGCQTCSVTGTSTQCSKCDSGKKLKTDYSCSSTCSSETEYQSTLDGIDKCLACSSLTTDCQKCAQDSNSNNICVLCSSNKWLSSGSSPTCGNQCATNTEFQETFPGATNGRCVPCGNKFANCKTCPTSGLSCSTCNDGYMLKLDGVCHPCTLTDCETCSWNTAEQCTKCKDPKYLKESTKTCVTKCEENVEAAYEPGGIKSCKDCTTVTTNCETCSSPGSGSSFTCTGCGTSNYLKGDTNTCVGSCPSNYYSAGDPANNRNGICTACTNVKANCNSCTSSECKHCASTYYFHPVNKDCSQTCPPGRYQDTSDPANPRCTLCSDIITSCSVCSTTGSSCTTCNTGYISKDSGATCVKCSTDCLECSYNSGSGIETCTKCVNSKYIKLDLSSCVSACTVKTEFANAANLATGTETCKLCSQSLDNCVECDSAGTLCSKCGNNQWLRNSDNRCYTTCQADIEYSEGLNTDGSGKCYLCENKIPNCQTCSGVSASLTCSSCKVGYITKDAGKTCVSCSISGCAECSYTTTETCLRCTLPKILSSNTCVTTCSTDNTKYNKDVNVNGAAAQVCTLCSLGAVLNCVQCTSNGATCNACPSGYFLNSKACSTCGSAITKCAICSITSGTLLVVCSKCEPGFRVSGNTCVACPDGCSECSDTACSSCFLNKFLVLPTFPKCEVCDLASQGKVKETINTVSTDACSYKPLISDSVSLNENFEEKNGYNFKQISNLCNDPIDTIAKTGLTGSKIYWVVALNGTDLSKETVTTIKTNLGSIDTFTAPVYSDQTGKIYGVSTGDVVSLPLRLNSLLNFTWFCVNKFGLESQKSGSIVVNGPEKKMETASLILNVNYTTANIEVNTFLCEVEKALGLAGKQLVFDDKGNYCVNVSKSRLLQDAATVSQKYFILTVIPDPYLYFSNSTALNVYQIVNNGTFAVNFKDKISTVSLGDVISVASADDRIDLINYEIPKFRHTTFLPANISTDSLSFQLSIINTDALIYVGMLKSDANVRAPQNISDLLSTTSFQIKPGKKGEMVPFSYSGLDSSSDYNFFLYAVDTLFKNNTSITKATLRTKGNFDMNLRSETYIIMFVLSLLAFLW